MFEFLSEKEQKHIKDQSAQFFLQMLTFLIPLYSFGKAHAQYSLPKSFGLEAEGPKPPTFNEFAAGLSMPKDFFLLIFGIISSCISGFEDWIRSVNLNNNTKEASVDSNSTNDSASTYTTVSSSP